MFLLYIRKQEAAITHIFKKIVEKCKMFFECHENGDI